jgi:hypothetical protein
MYINFISLQKGMWDSLTGNEEKNKDQNNAIDNLIATKEAMPPTGFGRGIFCYFI